MKECIDCKITKELSDFYITKKETLQYRRECKSCTKARNLKTRVKNRHLHNEQKKVYRKNNKDKIAESGKRYREDNKDRIKLYQQNHLKNNREYYRNKSAKRRTFLKTSLIYKNEEKDIKHFYKNCPEGYHVDHIIPLKNKEVCGLHCLKNLQYLPKKENLRKGNKFNSEEFTERNTQTL